MPRMKRKRILWQESKDSAVRVAKRLRKEGYSTTTRKLVGKYYVGKDRTTPKTIYSVSAKKKGGR